MKQQGALVGEKILTGKSRSTQPKSCDIAILFTKNPTRFDLRMNPDLPSNRPVTDCLLSNDTVRP